MLSWIINSCIKDPLNEIKILPMFRISLLFLCTPSTPRSSDAYMRQQTRSSLFQIMTYRLFSAKKLSKLLILPSVMILAGTWIEITWLLFKKCRLQNGPVVRLNFIFLLSPDTMIYEVPLYWKTQKQWSPNLLSHKWCIYFGARQA